MAVVHTEEQLGQKHRPTYINTGAPLLRDDLPPSFTHPYFQPIPMADGLQGVGLIEFFDLESDPILIFDLEDQVLAYENQSFRQWKQGNPRECHAFSQPAFLTWLLDWSTKADSAAFAVAGRTWRTNTLRKRWMVLKSPETHLNAAVQQQGVPPTPPANVPNASFSAPSLKDANAHRPGRDSPALSITSSISSGPDATAQWALDWTRYNVSGLSAHGQMIKAFPWHNTPIGTIDAWSESLRSAVVCLVANSEPRVLLWGAEHTMIYNEACAPLFGQKHPQSMGARGEDIWSEAWAALVGFITRAETEGKATRVAGIPLTMHRHGYDEETFWITNFMPVLGAKGRVAGVLDEFTEITNQVIQDRRRDNIIKLNESLTRINTLEELWSAFLDGMRLAVEDVPYCAVYTPTASSHDNPGGSNTPAESLHRFSLHGSVGAELQTDAFPAAFDLNANSNDHAEFIDACRDSWRTARVLTLHADEGNLPQSLAFGVPDRAGGAKVKTVCVIPVFDLTGHNQLAFVVVALTARRPHDTSATTLISSLSDLLTRSASTIFLPEEQRRTQQKFEELQTNLSQQLQTANLEAEKREAQYERLFASAPVGMYAITPEEKLLFYNDAYLACTGSSKELADSDEPPGNYLIHDDDREASMKQWYTCIADKVPITVEYRTKQQWKSVDPATGLEITGDSWVITSASPELDEHGNVTHIMGWILDISERKYHEQFRLKQVEEEQAEARFARLASEAPMGMYLLKPDGHPIYLNSAYYDILGFDREAFLNAEERGFGWADQILDEDRHIVQAGWQRLSEEGTPINIEYRVKKSWKTIDPATGTELTGPTWLQGTAFAEKGPDGEVITVQGFVTDISEKKFSERLLAERLEEALETKRQADRFIDMTSHEMRNPLSAILQSADGILTAVDSGSTERDLPDDVYESLVDAAQTIILCAQHQKRIVDDILTLSKLDSNLLVISPDRVSLPTLIERSFKMFDSELERTEIETSMEIEAGYTDLGVEVVMLDSSRVLQVIINLLTNAIKFTQHSEDRRIKIFLDAFSERPSGGNHNAHFIEQRAGRADQTQTTEWGTGEELFLQVAVQDSGRGLNEEELKLLFHRFQQASPKTYKQYGGSGLGLFISRELTELQGGQIGVQSQAGKGSTFVFYVKARRAVGSSGAADGNNLELSTLSRHSSRQSSATRSHSRDASWALGNGVYADNATGHIAQARRGSLALRRLPSDANPPPTKRGDQTTATAAGTGPAAKTMTKTSKSSSSSLHVLVVEDNEINQRVMANQLRRLGCTVYLAGNGVEALEFLRRTTLWNPYLEGYGPPPADPAPLSVILMDLEMPVLGGLGCVSQIRDLQREGKLLGHIPVIAVTANARSEQIAVAIEHGMDSVVTKPFRIPELLPRMEALVSRLAEEHGR